ncbi:MAG TPA: YciI family protein [Candidatus Binatia bacterium]|nr:YciI family protein [Candidatus Binatia bacterium]
MLFVIIGRDGPDAKELRPRLRPAHLEHLGVHDRRGRIRLAGPLTDGAGSLIVIEADSIEDVRRIADADPYVTGGVFVAVEIHPFLQVLPVPATTEPEKPR